jgi:hypothetical protein
LYVKEGTVQYCFDVRNDTEIKSFGWFWNLESGVNFWSSTRTDWCTIFLFLWLVFDTAVPIIPSQHNIKAAVLVVRSVVELQSYLVAHQSPPSFVSGASGGASANVSAVY